MNPEELARVVERTQGLVRAVVLPLDDEYDGDVEQAGGDSLRLSLQGAARHAGVLAPHAPVKYGGLGLNMVQRAPVFEAAGFSLFGPLSLNLAAPDEGNVHLLDHVASSAQREKYLGPLARGEVRSAFAMTEPTPGAGSDPLALTTRATKVDGGWVVNGRRWFITGADGAGFFVTSYDNALAETTNGLYKTECVYGPDTHGWDDVDELELATLSWVHWFKEDRLHGYCGDIPPAEYEAAFYAAQDTSPAGVGIQ